MKYLFVYKRITSSFLQLGQALIIVHFHRTFSFSFSLTSYLNMKFLFIFIFLWPLSLSDGNWSMLNTIESFFIPYRTDELNRSPKQISSPPKKLMDCKKLHATHSSPWVAIILSKESGRFICMGSIIDEMHILTAFKCVENRDPSTFLIVLGYFKAYWGRYSQVIWVEKIFRHEFQLVILKLKKVITFSKTVQPVTLLHKKSKSRASRLAPARPREQAQLSEEAALQKPFQSVKHVTSKTKVFGTANLNYDEKITALQDHFINQTDEINEIYTRRKGKRAGDYPIYYDVIKDFSAEWKGVTNVSIAGFPVTNMDTYGDPIHKSLVYSLRGDLVEDATKCKGTYIKGPHVSDIKNDPNIEKRFYCIKGESKFCWGCLGSPILDQKTMKQVGVVGSIRNVLGCEKSEKLYFALRVDIFIKWIREHSFYP